MTMSKISFMRLKLSRLALNSAIIQYNGPLSIGNHQNDSLQDGIRQNDVYEYDTKQNDNLQNGIH
jgi:hypothetical protein